ncbi:hypothetical protein D9M70_522020 [compost metagenome]
MRVCSIPLICMRSTGISVDRNGGIDRGEKASTPASPTITDIASPKNTFMAHSYRGGWGCATQPRRRFDQKLYLALNAM